MSTVYELDRKHVFHSWSAQAEITSVAASHLAYDLIALLALSRSGGNRG